LDEYAEGVRQFNPKAFANFNLDDYAEGVSPLRRRRSPILAQWLERSDNLGSEDQIMVEP